MEEYVILGLVVTVLTVCYVCMLSMLSMLLLNHILPIFDLGYPITFRQGCGIGTMIVLVISWFHYNETKKQS